MNITLVVTIDTMVFVLYLNSQSSTLPSSEIVLGEPAIFLLSANAHPSMHCMLLTPSLRGGSKLFPMTMPLLLFRELRPEVHLPTTSFSKGTGA